MEGVTFLGKICLDLFSLVYTSLLSSYDKSTLSFVIPRILLYSFFTTNTTACTFFE